MRWNSTDCHIRIPLTFHEGERGQVQSTSCFALTEPEFDSSQASKIKQIPPRHKASPLPLALPRQKSITKADTITAIGEEGLVQAKDLHEFDKDNLESVIKSLRNPPGKVVDTKLVPTHAHVISAKSKQCIVIATEATCYYGQIGCKLNADNMMWQT